MAIDKIIENTLEDIIVEYQQDEVLSNLIKNFLTDSIDQNLNAITRKQQVGEIFDQVIVEETVQETEG